MSSGCAATTRALVQSSGIGVGMAASCTEAARDGASAGTMRRSGGAGMRRAATTLLALVLLCGCGESPAPAPDRPAPITGEVLQFRRDSEARIVQVRLTSRDELVVDAVE